MIARTIDRGRRRAGILLALALLSAWPGGVQAQPAPPPGSNVHLVRELNAHRFWRGGAPRPETLRALSAAAGERAVPVTLFDLRHPANRDDRSGKGARLAPDAEEELARRLGLRYVSISALSRDLPQKLREALGRGDVYLHCMYGVNRTGFATARYARAEGVRTDRTGLGKHDWTQGERFQKGLPVQKR